MISLPPWVGDIPCHNYKIIKRSGPDHDPTFVVEVELDGMKNGQGRGKSKRAAEQAAAQSLLQQVGGS